MKIGRSRHIRSFSLLAALSLTATPSLTAGTVVFSDFGPGNSYNGDVAHPLSGSSSILHYQSLADEFTSDGNYSLTQVDVAVSHALGPGSSFVLDLDNGNGGSPGSTLATWTIGSGIPAFGTCCDVETVTPTTTISLSAGTQYWLVALPINTSTLDGWDWNSTGVQGIEDYQTKPGGAFKGGSTTLGAFDVLGNASAPEPASLGLTAGALCLLAGVWRRRRSADRENSARPGSSCRRSDRLGGSSPFGRLHRVNRRANSCNGFASGHDFERITL